MELRGQEGGSSLRALPVWIAFLLVVIVHSLVVPLLLFSSPPSSIFWGGGGGGGATRTDFCFSIGVLGTQYLKDGLVQHNLYS